jgi:multimeric flavodoxin WrbA
MLAISASPVSESSTDSILQHLADAVRQKLGEQVAVETSFVKLNDLTFIPCQACGESPEPKWCLYDDDLTPVYEELVSCDCLLFGTPVYFDSVSAQGKAFIDRCNCIRPPDYNGTDPDHAFIKRLHRKRPGAMVIVGGEDGWLEGARRTTAGLFKWVEVVNHGMIAYRTADDNTKGVAADDPSVMKDIEQMAVKLAEAIREDHDLR